MMTTTAVPPASATAPIRTFADILSAMGRDPELREAMRQHVLDEEFQQLPAAVRELRQLVGELQQTVAEIQRTVGGFMVATNARFDRLEAAQAETQADVAELKAGQDELKTGQDELRSDVDELKTGQAALQAGQDALEAGQAEILATLRSMQGTLNRLSGKEYERSVTRLSIEAARSALAAPYPKVIWAETLQDNAELSNLLDAAVKAGRISEAESRMVASADIILRDGAGGYCVAEVSITLDDSDITRARRRADLLAQATRAPAVPFVIGEQILDTSRETAAAHNVTVCILPDIDD